MSTDTTIVPADTAPRQQVAINDDGTVDDLLAPIDKTIKYFNDGEIVEGTIVKVDRDEVLLDIGYKTEGVIPSRELSIKHDVDPSEVVSVGDEVEALILDIGLRGFLPASLVEMRRVRDLQPYIGKEIEAKIIELDKNRNNVVLSRRAWLEQTQSEGRSEFLHQLQKGG